MSEPDEDPPVTGGRDLPESLVWRPSEPLEDVTDRLKFHQGQLRPHWLKMDVFRLFAELAAQAEEIRRLREALEPLVEIYRREPVAWEFMVANIDLRRAAKAMEPQTQKPKD
jgi:hypothetical protein